MRWPDKDPSDVLDYKLDLTALLDGDTIETATVAAEGVTVDDDEHDGSSVTVWLSGGSSGFAKVTITVQTNGDRTFERSVQIRVADL